MKEKRVFYSELSYLFGIIVLALGTALMERASFGMSMVVAPAYLIHLKVSEFLPFFSFGMSEYVFQAFLIIVLSFAVGGFKKRFVFSFLTAIFYGFTLDLSMWVIGLIPAGGLLAQAIFFILGLPVCSLGVALLFQTYIPLCAYELFVLEISKKFTLPLGKLKTVYDWCSCILGILLSFSFFGFGKFVGISWGTIVCALVNGWLIGIISSALQKSFDFKDALALRRFLS